MKKPEDHSSGATMQIDISDLEPRPPEETEAPPRSRATPPPLPPQGFAPPAAAAAPAPRSVGRLLFYGAIFVAFLAGAIFGGMKVGLALRGGPAPAAPSASATPTSAPAIVSIPMVEVTGPPDAQ